MYVGLKNEYAHSIQNGGLNLSEDIQFFTLSNK